MQRRRHVPGRRHFTYLLTVFAQCSGGGGGHAVAIEQRREQPTVYIAGQRNVVRRGRKPGDCFIAFNEAPQTMTHWIQATTPEAVRVIVGIRILHGG